MKKELSNKKILFKISFSFWLILIIGLASLVLLFYSNFIWKNFLKKNIPIRENLEQSYIYYHDAHILYERIISGDKSIKIEEVLSYLNKSLYYIDNSISPKANISKIDIISIKDSEILSQLNNLKYSLIQLKTLILKCKTKYTHKDNISSIQGNSLIYHIKNYFHIIIHSNFEKTNKLIKTNVKKLLKRTNMISNLILFIWLFLLASFSIIVFVKEKKRYKAEFKLKDTNENLEKIVVDKTKILTEAVCNLRHEKEFAESLVETAQTIILILDTNGKIVRFNKFMEKLSGYKLDEVKEKDWFTTFLPLCDYDNMRALFKKAVANIQTKGNVNPIVAKDGTSILIEWYDKTLKDHNGNVIGLLAIGYDITEKTAINNALINSEKKYRALFENTTEGILVADIETMKFKYANPAVCKMLLYTEDEFANMRVLDIHPKNKLDYIISEFNAQAKGEKVLSPEMPFLRKDGEIIYVDIKASPIEFDNIKFNVGFLTDVTKRVKHEKEAIRLKAAIEQIDENIIILDIDGNIQYINPAFCKTSGFEYNYVLGKKFDKFLYSDDPNYTFNELWACVSKGEVWKGTLLSKKIDDEIYKDAAIVSPIYNDFQEIINYVVVKRDITHEAKLEKRIRESQKIEAIGTLAGGIAHDFNNLLYAIMTYSELGFDYVSDDEKLKKYFAKILKACQRAKDLTQQILTFSSQQDEALKPLNLIPLLKEIIKFSRSILPSTIELVSNFENTRDLIFGSPAQIHQVVINILTNAAYSIGENKGKIKITLKQKELLHDFTFLYDVEPGNYLNLIIKDNGSGISPEILDRIFDPFYTTKPAGKGTGMGLSIVHGIIKIHKGIITVKSKLKKGTTFSLYFPITNKKNNKKNEPIEFIGHGNESILLVDDEEIIIDGVNETLKKAGYNITSTTESKKAYEYFLSDPKSFDLLITDQTMPELTGLDLIYKIKKIRHDFPTILLTGFNESNIFEKLKNDGYKYLLKPVSKDILLKTIREVLDKDIK